MVVQFLPQGFRGERPVGAVDRVPVALAHDAVAAVRGEVEEVDLPGVGLPAVAEAFQFALRLFDERLAGRLEDLFLHQRGEGRLEGRAAHIGYDQALLSEEVVHQRHRRRAVRIVLGVRPFDARVDSLGGLPVAEYLLKRGQDLTEGFGFKRTYGPAGVLRPLDPVAVDLRVIDLVEIMVLRAADEDRHEVVIRVSLLQLPRQIDRRADLQDVVKRAGK